MGKLTAAVLLCACLAACKKAKQPEQVPQPKMEETQAAAPAVSTAAVTQNPLEAPGNYLKSTVGQIQKAKDAKALYEESAKKSMGSLDLNDTGGN